MNLTDSVALVTGAIRGLGACLVTELLDAGAAKVYATSRAGTAAAGHDPRVRPLPLDVTDPASVAAAAAVAGGRDRPAQQRRGPGLRHRSGRYTASKAAAHSITQALRAELRPLGISVLGAYPGGIDTGMLAGVEAPKAPPQQVASRIVAALAAGQNLTFPDDASAAAGDVYLSDPVKLQELLTG